MEADIKIRFGFPMAGQWRVILQIVWQQMRAFPMLAVPCLSPSKKEFRKDRFCLRSQALSFQQGSPVQHDRHRCARHLLGNRAWNQETLAVGRDSIRVPISRVARVGKILKLRIE